MSTGSDRVSIPEGELVFRFVLASGPGGQAVNRNATKAELRWTPAQSRVVTGSWRQRFLERYASRITGSGELVLTSDKTRSQVRNREDCLARLNEMVESVRRPPKKRQKTKPSRSSKRKRTDDKKKKGRIKELRGRIRHD